MNKNNSRLCIGVCACYNGSDTTGKDIWKRRQTWILIQIFLKRGAERGNKAGNGCPCAKGSHTVVFLPGNFGGKDDGDTQAV